MLYRLTSLDEPIENMKNNIGRFDLWYKKWLNINDKNNQDIEVYRKEEDLFSNDIDDEVPIIDNEILQ